MSGLGLSVQLTDTARRQLIERSTSGQLVQRPARFIFPHSSSRRPAHGEAAPSA